MDMTDHTLLPGQLTAGPPHAGPEHICVDRSAHRPGCGPVDLGSGKIVIELQQQHAILPARPKVEEESADPDEEPEPEGA